MFERAHGLPWQLFLSKLLLFSLHLNLSLFGFWRIVSVKRHLTLKLMMRTLYIARCCVWIRRVGSIVLIRRRSNMHDTWVHTLCLRWLVVVVESLIRVDDAMRIIVIVAIVVWTMVRSFRWHIFTLTWPLFRYWSRTYPLEVFCWLSCLEGWLEVMSWVRWIGFIKRFHSLLVMFKEN